MKATIRSVSLVGSLLIAPLLFAEGETGTSVISSEDNSLSQETFSSAVIPDGQTLPRNVIRARVATRSTLAGSKTYDENGTETASSIDPDILGAALLVDFGITEQVSAGLMVPYRVRNNLSFNDPKIAAVSEKTGKTGLGDLEIGVLYNFLRNDMWRLSAGLGGRLATGAYSDIPGAYLTPGKGFNEIGLRLNADFQPVYGLWVSLQHQEEIAVSSAERKESTLNQHEVVAASYKTDKKGLSRNGFAQAAYGLGAASSHLKALYVKGRYAYAYDAKEESNSLNPRINEKKAAFTQFVGAGAGLDGRAYNMPLALEAYYQVPVAGTNNPVASKTLDLTLSSYIQI